MGIVGFKWGAKEMTLFMNRYNWETRVIERAHWHGPVLRSCCEETGGTWFGVTRGGRVAFAVHSSLFLNIADDERGSETIPIEFLESNLSPDMFAAQLEEDEKEFHLTHDDEETFGREYELIVADITSGSMVHISKPSEAEPAVIKKTVAFGVHTLSVEGLDSNATKDSRLRNLFNAMIGEYKDKELPKLNELAAKFMYDTTKSVQGDDLTALFVDMVANLPSSERDQERYGTTSTTAFVVDSTKKAMFYERYLENGMWKEHDVTFNIA